MRIGRYTGQRPLYQASTFETWDGAAGILTVAGARLESDAALMRELALVVDGVAPLLAIETVEGRQVMIEARPDGASLLELAPLEEPGAARLLLDLAEIAAAAHGQGLAITGLSPHLCFADGSRITGVAPRGPDFANRTRPDGLARPWRDAIYSAPELWQRNQVHPSCASFSIALIAAFLLSARHAYPIDEGAASLDRFVLGEPVEIEASDGFAALVRAATARDPAARPLPFEMARWLRSLAAGEPVDVAGERRVIELRGTLEALFSAERSRRAPEELERELPRLAELPKEGDRAGRFVLGAPIAMSAPSDEDPLAVPEAVWRGGDPDRPVLISVTPYRWGVYGDRRAALALDVDGVAPMLYLGPVVGREYAIDALVEVEPEGEPLAGLAPLGETAAARILAPLAALLATAAAREQVLAGLRPERVYVDGERLTGVAPRGEELFEVSCYSRGFLPRRYPRRVCYPGRYAEPERGRDLHDSRQGLSPASDVFSLAAIGFFLVTGRHLDWTGALERAAAAPWPAPRLAALLRPALSRDPRLRPGAAALAPALAGLGQTES